MADERRRFPRLKDSVEIRWREIQAEGFPGEGTESLTINISGGGVCFGSDVPLEPGKILAVEMNLPDFEAPVVAMGRVSWCTQGREQYEIGTEFWWIGWGSDSVQRSIGDHIRRALESD